MMFNRWDIWESWVNIYGKIGIYQDCGMGKWYRIVLNQWENGYSKRNAVQPSIPKVVSPMVNHCDMGKLVLNHGVELLNR